MEPLKTYENNNKKESLEVSLVAQMVKNLPAMQGTQAWSLCQEYPLEKGMSTHSSILAWKIPWTEESGRLQSIRLQRVRHNWETNTFIQRTALILFSKYLHPHDKMILLFVATGQEICNDKVSMEWGEGIGGNMILLGFQNPYLLICVQNGCCHFKENISCFSHPQQIKNSIYWDCWSFFTWVI